jgi:endo-1,4-beta-xylanase
MKNMSLCGMFTRRSLLAAAALPLLSRNAVAQTPFKISNKNVSAVQTIPFGLPYYAEHREHAIFSETIAKYATEIVDGNRMSMLNLNKQPGPFDFTGLDKVVAFAERNRKTMRGSHLIWQDSMPKWVTDITSSIELERVMNNFIRTVMMRYRGRIYNYIVANEVIAHPATKLNELRANNFLSVLGPNYVAMAFKMAAEADPSAQLMINEYDVEYNTPFAKARREALKNLIFSIKSKGIKIDAVGLQSHLYPIHDIDHEGMARFAEEMAKANIKIHITELDISDQHVKGNAAERDLTNARYIYRYLDSLNSVQKLASITTWGVTDRDFYQNTWKWLKREDGTRLRGLPFDENYQPKPMLSVIEHFTKGTPLYL